MATGKVTAGATRGPKLTQSESLTKISTQTIASLEHVFTHWVDAGRSNLMQGYASTIVITDMLHSAKLISERAYDAVFVLSTIMSLISGVNIGSILGITSSPFTPQLKSNVTQEGGGNGNGGGGGADVADMAANAASLSSILPAVALALA